MTLAVENGELVVARIIHGGMIDRQGTLILIEFVFMGSISVFYLELKCFINQLPRLSGRWVPGIPRGLHCGQPAPR